MSNPLNDMAYGSQDVILCYGVRRLAAAFVSPKKPRPREQSGGMPPHSKIERRWRQLIGVCTGLLVFSVMTAPAAAAQPFAAINHPALPAPRAASALLLDVARAGDRLVAVGMQGVIITSDDDGRSWIQATVPVSTLLTAVAFADATHGWAVGQAGTVLRSSDQGKTWRRVAMSDPGHEASFLDVLVLASGHVLLAGAYGILLETRDDGATWSQLAPPVDDFHVNRLTRGRDGTVYAAGESGTLAASRDAGATWELYESPYDGSFYGLHELSSGRLLAHGLRGHALVSDDAGATWTPVEINEPVLLMTACETSTGAVVVAGAGGHVFTSTDGGATFAHRQPEGLTSTAEIVVASDGTLLAVGETGAQRLDHP